MFAYFLLGAGSYLLMLSIMTYSTGIFLGVCGGLTAGYLVVQKAQPNYLASIGVAKAHH